MILSRAVPPSSVTFASIATQAVRLVAPRDAILGGELGPPFRELLARLRDATLEAYAHQDLPFEKMVEVLAPDRSNEAQPLFQAFLAFQNAPMPALELPGLVLRSLEIEVGSRSPLVDLVRA